MNSSIEFADALGSAEQLGNEAQAELVAVLSHRLAEQGLAAGRRETEEFTLLPDGGRVRLPARGIREIAARIIVAGRQTPRLRAEVE